VVCSKGCNLANQPLLMSSMSSAPGLRGTPDPALLELAAQEGRIVITHDRGMMLRHFTDRLHAGQPCSGIFVVPQDAALGEITESLLLVWAASQAEEWRNQIVYLPFR